MAREHYAKQLGIDPALMPVHVGMLPENIAKRLTGMPEGILYLPGSYTTMAARKQLDRVRTQGPVGLHEIWTRNYKGLHVNREQTGLSVSDAQIIRDLPRHVHRETEEDYEYPLTDQQKRLIGSLVARYFSGARYLGPN
jgi:hypothetical protein